MVKLSSRAASNLAECVNALFVFKTFSLSYILSCLCRFPHLFLSSFTSFAIFIQWFLLYHFCMNNFLCLWRNVAIFFVAQCLISSPPNPPNAFHSSWKTRTIFDSFNFERYQFPADSLLSLNLWNTVNVIIIYYNARLPVIKINLPAFRSLIRQKFSSDSPAISADFTIAMRCSWVK